jgi:putative spermidine/putrescine transport system permease protein/spermidine/putrescine transport system permease protein
MADARVRLVRDGFVAVLAAFILLPIVVATIMGFSADTVVRFPARSWGLRWYAEFLGSDAWLRAFANSLQVALVTTALSVPTGVLTAWIYVGRFGGRSRAFYLLMLMPLFLPGVALGLALAMTAGQISVFGVTLFGSKLLLALAHSLLATPIVFLVTETGLRTLDRRLIEAAADLGASPVRRFFGIALPLIRTSIFAAAVFAFVVSLNEFILALFLTTRDSQTLPVLLWLSLRSATSPVLAVATTVLTLAVSLAVALAAVATATRRRRHPI